MKLVSTQLAYFLNDNQVKHNVRALLKYVAFVVLVMVIFAVIFHVIMEQVEGEYHSWVTGFYWTLTVMSTLGFGDITFESDIGRFFSIVVLISGIILLLIVLPFAFIRYFYAPWLEARIRSRAPRTAPADMQDHVIIASYDRLAQRLILRLKEERIPYVVLEPDPTVAADHHLEDVVVVAGAVDDVETYKGLNLAKARLLVANREDTVNANIILTAHEVAPEVEVAAIAAKEDSIDVLELTGARHVLPLKKWLGEQLASRVSATRVQTSNVGRYKDLMIAEFPAYYTKFVGKTIRETELRERKGLSIIGVWKRGHLNPARPDEVLNQDCVLVVIGNEVAMEKLNQLFVAHHVNTNPVVVIGGGTVGSAAARALAKRGVGVHLIEQNPVLSSRLKEVCQKVLVGDAADYDLLMESGIMEAPSVILSTNDDAANIYLASYCRHLNPKVRIVSRITHTTNIESIHRAGADFVLSYDSLGIAAVRSILKGRELIVMGEGIDLFSTKLPQSMSGCTVAETGIGKRTGLIIVAIQNGDETVTNPTASTVLEEGSELLMFGDSKQRQELQKLYAGEG